MAAYKWITVQIITTLLITLFLYTAIDKFYHHDSFENALKKSTLIGGASAFLSWMVPTTEVLISTLLFIPSTRTRGLKASLFLLSGFTIYLMYMISTSPELPCTCGGVISSLNWREHIVFNASFILLTIAALRILQQPKDFIAINRTSRKPV